jgi:hypothetical protein
MLKVISSVIAAAAFAGVLALLWATNTRIDAKARDAAPQSSPVPQTAPTLAATAMSPDLVRLDEVARDLAAMRDSIDQLANKVEEIAAKQDQMSQNIVASQAVEQDIIQEKSSPSLSGPGSPPPRKKARRVAPLAAQSSMSPPTFAPQ